MIFKRVFKYPIADETKSLVALPYGANVIRMALQDGAPHLWAEVDPHADYCQRLVTIIPTGGFVPEGDEYLGTYEIDGHVAHVYLGAEK